MLESDGRTVMVEDTEATAQAMVDVITGVRDEAWFQSFVAPHIR